MRYLYLFNRSILFLFFIVSCACSACSDITEHPLQMDDANQKGYKIQYVGDQIEGESGWSVGRAIGLSWWKRMALGKAMRKHERELKNIERSDYAPYLQGILLQTENERYRNSIIRAIGYENYCRWFDDARGGLDRKIKESYSLDDDQFEQFKRIVKQHDIALRLIKRSWSTNEEKKAGIDSIILKRNEELKPILKSDIPFTDILLRTDETKY